MKKLLSILFIGGILNARAQQFTLIKDINPGTANSNICYTTDVNNNLFFGANDGLHGMELWKSNGTTAGTVLVRDINPGASSSSIGYLTNVNGILFFVANDGILGTELWKTDGTFEGTVMVKDIRSGSMGSNPSSLVNVNGILFFAANNGINGMELWKSDGTEAGTVLIKDINPGSSAGYPQSLANMNGIAYFAADDSDNGVELWKSDGTAAGTTMIIDIWSGNDDSYPFDLTVIGNTLFFTASDATAGAELWKTDGTPGGTVLIKDIWPGINDGYPFGLKEVGGTLFFSANNGTSGIELWKTDGTSSGTMLVKDVWPGEESGSAGNFSRFINKLLFTGNDGINGDRIWESDGTAGGTSMTTIINNPPDAGLSQLVETESVIFAAIEEETTGKELWGISYSVILPLRLLDFNGTMKKNDIFLSWETGNELNAGEFIVERSGDGREYKAIGKVKAKNISGTHHYHFTDLGAAMMNFPVVYYRLKQVDIDSRYTYSKVISIALAGHNSFSIFPNPASGEIRISIGSFRGPLQMRMFDNAGKIVNHQTGGITHGGTYQSIDISQLPNGIYYLDLRTNDLNSRMRFVKQR